MADSFLPPVVAVLMSNITQFASGMGEAEGIMGSFKAKAAEATGISANGLTAIGTAAVAVGAISIKMAADFEQATNRLVTSAGETQDNIGNVRQGILDMAGSVGFTAQELAKGMYTVDSAGFHAADSLTILKAAAQGAKIEQADLGTTVDAVTTSLVDYHLGADQAATVMSKLVTAVGEGKTNLQDLAGSLHSVTPLAANLGITLDEVTAAVATMTVHGMSADQATQNLADTIRHLSNPTQTMISEMGQLGLNSQTLAQNLSNPTIGLHGVLEQIYTTIMNHMGPAGQVLLGTFKQSASAGADLAQMISAMPAQLQTLAKGMEDGSVTVGDYRKSLKDLPVDMQGMATQFLSLYEKASGFSDALKSGSPEAQTFDAALAKIMGDSTGLNTALMLGGENADRFNQNIKQISGSSADASGNVKNWSDVQNTLNQKLADLEGSASKSAVTLGNQLLPAVKNVLDFLNAHNDDLDKFNKKLDDSAGAVHDFIVGAFNNTQDFFNNIFGLNVNPADEMHKAMQKSMEQIQGDGTAIGTNFANGVVGTTPQVVDAAGKLVSSLSGPLTMFNDKIYTDGSQISSKFADGVLATIPQVDSAAGTLVSHLDGVLGAFTGVAFNEGDTSGTQFANGVQSTLPGVSSAATGLVTGATGILDTAPPQASTAGQNTGSSFANGLALPLPSVAANANSLSTGATAPLGNLGPIAYGSGSSIGSNLAAGMEAEIQHVSSAAAGLAASVRAHLPSSPAKKGPLSGSGSPDILGRNIGLMIAAGLDSSTGNVTTAMGNMLSFKGGGSFSSGYGVASGGPGGGNGMLQTVIINLDGKQIYNQTQRVSLRQERNNISNGLSRYTQR
ncbi:MAG TPA: phage tail tape measure protein [Candidatus Saccharimonadales bacterium]|nr:phage tail tape measure protein [Candidatus Saccharimonadales bacterium]